MSEHRSDEVARSGAIGGLVSEHRSAEGARSGAIEGSRRKVLVLNGPNLGRLGTREPVIYGSTTHAELAALCVKGGSELELDVEVRQTDSEAELIGWVHEASDGEIAVVLNAGALTHTSIALRDAVAARTAALVEVHISNVHAREEFRHHSYISAVASGSIVGLGVEGYVLALSWISSAGEGR